MTVVSARLAITAELAAMLYPLSTLALGPILIGQGHYVRRVTPSLPEPEGERDGVIGAGPELRLLIVGDSAAAGVGVPSQSEALAGRLAAQLGRRFRLQWRLLAETGRTSGDVVRALAQEPEACFDVALVSIGVNDVTGRTRDRQWLKHLDELSGQLAERFSVSHTLFTAIPPMHLFPALPQPLRWYLGLRARQLNGLLEDFCRHRAGTRFLSVGFPPEPGYMAADGFHPGADAYRVWAEHSATVICELTQTTAP
ncbi:SGNH/GDSL hydrolase family protein [Marinobacter sp. M216]|uniref:SGNH/GDSL hydrolase family protein n=1 Tax=Marinobacter albus TaxID=3030833 RepID=A0ABT7H7X6_9GAMM|nr:SGNH/GDSL hydrolase family protein [Marinobacter sp. M216]MDK9556042.1 SGNH/GDSL hydrolase family protein [Marinobacter sp. M216]